MKWHFHLEYFQGEIRTRAELTEKFIDKWPENKVQYSGRVNILSQEVKDLRHIFVLRSAPGQIRLIRSHSLSHFSFEFSVNSNYNMKLLLYPLIFDEFKKKISENFELRANFELIMLE